MGKETRLQGRIGLSLAGQSEQHAERDGVEANHPDEAGARQEGEDRQ